MRMIELECSHCHQTFERPHKQWKYQSKVAGENYKPYCSNACQGAANNTSITVSCAACGKETTKVKAEYDKSEHHFCSHTCSATFNNRERAKRGYTNKGKQKNAICVDCGVDTKIGLNAANNTARCTACYDETHSSPCRKIRHSKCIDCGMSIQGGASKRYCDDCRSKLNKRNGVKAGQAAAAVSVRRSKNEIYFAELCSQLYTITTNERFFKSKYGCWDADVILHEQKIAVLWNGIYHYKQVKKGQSLKQVQSRDKIKMDVIKDNGYVAYVIKDMGKHNKNFVEEQFELFKRFVEGFLERGGHDPPTSAL